MTARKNEPPRRSPAARQRAVGVACGIWLLACAVVSCAAPAASNIPAFYLRKADWPGTLLASRTALLAAELPAEERHPAASRIWQQVADEFAVQWDWVLQDYGAGFPEWFREASPTRIERALIARALETVPDRGGALGRTFDSLCRAEVPGSDPRWLSVYVRICEQRRALRLKTVHALAPRMVFTKHPTIRPSFFAYTEGQSDAQNERHFLPGSALCQLEMQGLYGEVRTLLEDPRGAIRDPAVSTDAQRVVFAWKKSLNDDDYHLYELELASGKLRQLTFGLGFADYEPAYLPGGDIIFASTRCVQTVDCWWTEVSNLYTCDRDGRFLRRLGFDQVHTVYPSVMDDGRVIYTRWDYNDRGQIFPQALFQMNPDGTAQSALYGNNSYFPTTIAHARGIPGTQKVMAIFCGHHTSQAGKLGILDPARGREENTGAQLVAPVRETRAERIDAYGQEGELFQYPFPLTEREFLVTYAPLGWAGENRRGDARFGIYWMDLDGHRELLASDPKLPCSQAVPLRPRPEPAARSSLVDYRKTDGTYYVQDVHAGPGLAGVPRGSIRGLRVVALEFRPAGVGANYSSGPAGGALVSTPIAIGNGSWDVKVVLGEAKVHDDGSAFFKVPARTPVYFQALDEKGRAVQTMRSWTTLQPGENQSCVGCHEDKNSTPPMTSYGVTLALRAGPQALTPFHSPARGFSFSREVQPILDRHCVRCHHDRSLSGPTGRTATAPNEPAGRTPSAFSLLGEVTVDLEAKRKWSDAYLAFTGARREDLPFARKALLGNPDGRLVNWISSQSGPSLLPPGAAGSTRSGLLPMLEQGHHDVALSRAEFELIACWIDLLAPYCGDYTEANAWNEAERQKFERFLDKRKRMEQIERQNIEAFVTAQAGGPREQAQFNPPKP